MHQIKINRARIMSSFGQYPRTWDAIINALPLNVIAKLSSRELVELIDVWQQNRQSGAAAEMKDL
jgi:hypothetical protein